MWPSSCSPMDTSSPNRKMTIPSTCKHALHPTFRRDECPSAPSRPRLSGLDGLDGRRGRAARTPPQRAAPSQRSRGTTNVPSANAATHSSFAALNTAGCSSDAASAARATRIAGNVSSSSGSNVHACGTDQSGGDATSSRRSGQRQSQRDGKPHVWRRGLRDRRAVDELHHGVDHRLRVHHDVRCAPPGCRTAGAPRSPRAPC